VSLDLDLAKSFSSQNHFPKLGRGVSELLTSLACFPLFLLSLACLSLFLLSLSSSLFSFKHSLSLIIAYQLGEEYPKGKKLGFNLCY
jgi:hypothetical protein